MSSAAIPTSRPRIVYPDTDGLPMAENTLQFEWIVTIKGGLDHLFDKDPNVFVAGDLFWYPVEGHPEIRMAPDAMVAFGRPKGHRLSYLQWEEGNIPPQVVFEVLSPGNRFGEMMRKFEFYQRYGVEEYYIYNPDPQRHDLSGFVRREDQLLEVPEMNGHQSPRLGVKFEMTDAGLRILRPDGQPFLTYEEVARREEQERQRADQERQRAEQERQRADQERQRADQAVAQMEQMRQRLRSLGHDSVD
jgi:Uma2 family endonuclease